MENFAGIILAAGLGKRMKSKTPKVLHKLLGIPLILYPLEKLESLGFKKIFLVISPSPQQKQITELLGNRVEYIYQDPPKGTGDALLKALPYLEKKKIKNVMVLSGDMPLIQKGNLKNLLKTHLKMKPVLTLLSACSPEPGEMGRVLKTPEEKLLKIIEKKSCSPEELKINEVNLGTYCFAVNFLKKYLSHIPVDKKSGEIYLTHLAEMAAKRGEKLLAISCADAKEGTGVNSRNDLSKVTLLLKEMIIEELMEKGVGFIDPTSVFISPEVKIAKDTTIFPFTLIEGKTTIGSNCTLGPNCRLIDCQIGNQVAIQYAVLNNAKIEDDCDIGPFAYLRDGVEVKTGAKVGTFVEIKKSLLAKGAKVPHLSYIGDAKLGKNVNIGAGTITCNFDGVKKHQTLIEDDALIGANTNLVAPVRIGKGAKTGAGAVVTSDVPPHTLAVGVPARFKKNLK